MKPLALISVALLSSAVACSNGHVSTTVPAPALAGHNEPRELADEQQVKQALDRLTYGPRPSEAVFVRREGLDRWLKQQLTPENWADRGADSALATVPVVRMTIRELVDSSPQQDVYIKRRRAEL
ncbi:MAG: hypothetical protein ABJC26_18735, partial [Gemmatimonadaceae bacterium]